ncbi:MAG: dihydropteroate synthase [Pseudomonadota bacterium]|nr:dihydropteroate synthase [Pseudomonadota bacterium]MDE3038327.1 dihydropteroate synthase [Pseudomonadota bacterium]
MAEIVGILNVTPDSFSDGGAFFTPKAAIGAIAEMAEQGVDVIDIGAESTRPGATPITPEEEWRRLQPVLSALPHFGAVRFSVDTRHAETARRALKAGAHWINDVEGFSDPAMLAAVGDSDCRMVVMHSLGVPADKNVVLPESADVTAELLEWAHTRMGYIENAGVARDRIIFDPGIGFGKTAAQSLAILRSIEKLKTLNVPIMVGHSRKSFLASFGGRDSATLVVSQYLAAQGTNFLRVHEVAAHRRMLNVTQALYG